MKRKVRTHVYDRQDGKPGADGKDGSFKTYIIAGSNGTEMEKPPICRHFSITARPYMVVLPNPATTPYGSEFRYDIVGTGSICSGDVASFPAAMGSDGNYVIVAPCDNTIYIDGTGKKLVDHLGVKMWAHSNYPTVGSTHTKIDLAAALTALGVGDGSTVSLHFIRTAIKSGGSTEPVWQLQNAEDFLTKAQQEATVEKVKELGYQDAAAVRGIVSGYGYQTQTEVSAQITRQVLQARMRAQFSYLSVEGLSSLAGLSVKVNTPAEVGRANQVSISAKEFGYIDIWGGNQPGTLRITDLDAGGLLLLHISDRTIPYWHWNGTSIINGGTGLRLDVNNGAWQYIKKPGLYLIHRFSTSEGKIEIHRIANYDSQEGNSYVYY